MHAERTCSGGDQTLKSFWNTIAMMIPYIATASQKMIEIRFLVLIRGALTPAPRIDEPVMKMPQAAPTTENEIAIAIPRVPQRYGDVSVKYLPGRRDSKRARALVGSPAAQLLFIGRIVDPDRAHGHTIR